MVLSLQRGHLTSCNVVGGAVPPALPGSMLYMFKGENYIANNCSGLSVAENMLSMWLWWIMWLESEQDCLATGKIPESRQNLIKSSLLTFPTCVCSKLTARKE